MSMEIVDSYAPMSLIREKFLMMLKRPQDVTSSCASSPLYLRTSAVISNDACFTH